MPRVFVLLLALFAACGDDTTTPARTIPRPTSASPAARRGPDRQNLEWLAEIPGFGGYYFDPQGNLHAFLTDLDHSELARSKLSPVVRERPKGYSADPVADPRVVIHQGRYDYAQLLAFRQLATRHLFSRPGVTGVGIDVKRNNVRIEVTTTEAAADLRTRLENLGVATEAFGITVVARFRPFPEPRRDS
jgi:hypothetical protein